MNPEFDNDDQEILNNRIELWDKRNGPRVGDYIQMLDGTMRRFTHDWDDTIQTTTPGDKFGSSFYFGKGYMEFSGGLDRAIPKDKITATNETKDGRAWFFHHDWATAHNGVDFNVPCRVYRQIEVTK